MQKKERQKYNGLVLMASHFTRELKAVLYDRGALLILIGAMIIYPVVYSIGYYNEVMTGLNIGVVDLDHSHASRKYIQMLDASQELDITHEPLSLLEAEDLFMHNKLEGVILIPKGFERDIMRNEPTNVSVYSDASFFLKYRNTYMAAAVVNGYFGAGVSVNRYMFDGKSFEQAKVAIDPLPVRRKILYNPSSGYASYLMPGLVLIIMQQTLLLGIGMLGGSFSESKASPFILPEQDRRKEIVPYLFGKTGAYVLISLLNIVFGAVFVHHWFNYPDKAHFMDVLVLLFPYVLSVTFLGIGLSTLFKHRESAIVFMVFLSPIALFVSGLSWPLSSMPDWLVAISKLMPSSTVVPAYLRLRTMGVGIMGVKHEILLLYGMTVIFGALTVFYFLYRLKHKNQHH